jgi:Flp pilus assembly protein TadG
MTATYSHNCIARRQPPRPSRIAVVCSRACDSRGAALVEFALVLPLLLVLLFGIAQFGLAINSANDETHLANEVARYATVNQNPAAASSESLQEWGKKQADSKALTGQTVCISFPNGTGIGAPVEVKVTGAINWFPVLRLKVASTVIEGKADMRLEASPSAYKAGCA